MTESIEVDISPPEIDDSAKKMDISKSQENPDEFPNSSGFKVPSNNQKTKAHFKTPIPEKEQLEEDYISKPVTKTFLSPAELLKSREEELNNIVVPSPIEVPLKYKEPDWSQIPSEEYCFEVLKEGKQLPNIVFPREKSKLVVGRLVNCDIQMEHPSISRHHAVIQYGNFGIDQAKGTKPTGWYVYDMGSTHGTVINKLKIPPKQYIRIHVGHVIKFGGSTRLLILQGPDEDMEMESKLSVTEIREKALKRKLRAEGIINIEDSDKLEVEEGNEETIYEEQSSAMAWGMSEDYGGNEGNDDEFDEGEEMDMESMQKRESYYKDDPKKVLTRFFDREGYELEFEYEERGIGVRHAWVCKISLPMIDTPSGHALKAEAVSSGSKKEAQAQGCLEACRTLDAHNILRRASQASETSVQKRNQELKNNDFYDSDEDNFYDRTGELEMKRDRRKNRIESNEGKVIDKRAETYDGLMNKVEFVNEQVRNLEFELNSLGGVKIEEKRKGVQDSLDEFMVQVHKSEPGLDPSESQENKMKKSRLRLQINELNKQAQRYEKLARIAKPVTLPALNSGSNISRFMGKTDPEMKPKMIWVGSMKGHRLRKTAVPISGDNVTNCEPELKRVPEENLGADSETALQSNKQIEEEDIESVEDDPFVKAKAKLDIRGKRDLLENKGGTQVSMKIQKVYTVEMPNIISDLHANSPMEEVENETHVTNTMETHVTNTTENVVTNVMETHENTEDNSDIKDNEMSDNIVKKCRGRKNRKKREENGKEKVDDLNEYDDNNPDYAMWMPPDNQKGDGNISLNDKFGY